MNTTTISREMIAAFVVENVDHYTGRLRAEDVAHVCNQTARELELSTAAVLVRIPTEFLPTDQEQSAFFQAKQEAAARCQGCAGECEDCGQLAREFGGMSREELLQARGMSIRLGMVAHEIQRELWRRERRPVAA